MLYVAASIRAVGHEVVVFDCAIEGRTSWRYGDCLELDYTYHRLEGSPYTIDLVGVDPSILTRVIEVTCPDVIGLAVPLSTQHYFVPAIIKVMKESAPEAIVVLGGTHATLAADTLIKMEGVDYVITGEGEFAFPWLLGDIEKKEESRELPGVYYKDGRSSPFSLIADIDTLPPPARDLVSKYAYYSAFLGQVYHLSTSRGCPFACYFCPSLFMHRRKWRPHSVDRVLAEIELCVGMGAEEIRFVDDNAALNKDRCMGILEGVVTNNWPIKLTACNLYGPSLDKEMLTMMKKMGWERVLFAPDSGNDRVLEEELGKVTTTVAESEKTFRLITEVGLIPDINIIIGSPGETWAEIQDSVAFCRKMREINPACGIDVFCATPILGTKLYDRVVERGLFPGGIPFRFSYVVSTYDGIDWTKEELVQLRNDLMIEFKGYL